MSYAPFYTCREVSIVIVLIDTRVSSDEELLVVGPRDQGNGSRDQQTPTFLDSQARFARETCRGWNQGCGGAESAGGEPGQFHLKRPRGAASAEAPGTCRRRCCPVVPPVPRRAASLAAPGPRSPEGVGTLGEEGSECIR